MKDSLHEIVGVAITNKLLITDVYVRGSNISFTSLPKPFRHHHVIELMNDRCIKTHGKIQGFFDNNGNFLDRKEAYSFCLKHNIPLNRRRPGGYDGNSLYSECLW